ncbi:MAG: septal ring lytic transglycosylase RlpA family lipoprotein [Legionellales bacterium]|nr:septal ring lytic transglycosylase RlpA family lipoprotein [Legionellales bacterium]|tara:strand:- start:43573 stop:44367 length:795 start_codon:yes stop_codon:yes gene_type:complete
MKKGLLIILCCFAAVSISFADDDAPNPYLVQMMDLEDLPDAVPKLEPHSHYGNPPHYTVLGKTYHVMKSSNGYDKRGIASWYGTKFHGHATSSGETYDMFAMTAANKTLPLPTYVQVTNLDNGKQVIVKVNDRGPFHEDRIIDLSYAAAFKLGMLEHGTAHVEVTAIDPRLYQAPESTEAQTLAQEFTEQQLFLQVGVFDTQDSAEEYADEIRQLTDVPVDVAMIDANAVYRVKIGPLVDEEESISLNQTLQASGLKSGFLVSV